MTAAALTEGELAELESELQTLSNAEEIKSSLCGVEELISSSSYEGTSMDSALKEAAKLLSKVSIYLSDAASLSERVDSCRAEINDILSDVSRINSGIDLSEARLQQVEDRIALIYDLMRRYGCADEAELIAFGKSLEEKVRRSNPEDMELERQELIRQEKAAQAEVDRLCASLQRKGCPCVCRRYSQFAASTRTASFGFQCTDSGQASGTVRGGCCTVYVLFDRS